jgi:hypothetical protein
MTNMAGPDTKHATTQANIKGNDQHNTQQSQMVRALFEPLLAKGLVGTIKIIMIHSINVTKNTTRSKTLLKSACWMGNALAITTSRKKLLESLFLTFNIQVTWLLFNQRLEIALSARQNVSKHELCLN